MKTSRYQELVNNTTFNCEFWRGTYEDLSDNKYSLNVTELAYRKYGLSQLCGGVISTSASVTRMVSVLEPFAVEIVFKQPTATSGQSTYLVRQVGAAGGFYSLWSQSTNQVACYIRNAAGASAATIAGTTGTVTENIVRHILWWIDGTSGTGGMWYNGLPVTSTVITPAWPGADQDAQIQINSLAGGGLVRAQIGLARVWQSTMSNEDAQCLYQHAKTIFGDL